MVKRVPRLAPFTSRQQRSSKGKSRTRRIVLRVEQLEDRRLLVGHPFQMAILETGTPVPEFNNGLYTLAVADWDLDGKEDMFAIKTKSTTSGKVEVSVYSGASDFQTKIAQLTTALASTTADRQYRIIQSSPTSKPKLAVFNPAGSGGFVTVDVMAGTSNFATTTRYTTALASSTHWAFDMADYNGDGVDDVYGMFKKASTHTAEVTVLSGANLGAGVFKSTLLTSETPTDDQMDDSFEFRVRKWNPGDVRPDIVVIKRQAPSEFSNDGFLLVWDYEGRFNYTSMRAAVITEPKNTPGGFYQFDVRDIQGSATTHDEFPELIMFSTFGTGTQTTELHLFVGTYAPEPIYVFSPPGSTVPAGIVAIDTNGTYDSRGSDIEHLETILGDIGSKLKYSIGAHEVIGPVTAGTVAVLDGGAMVVPKQNTVNADVVLINSRQVAVATVIDGTLNADLKIDSGAVAAATVNGDVTAGSPNVVTDKVLLSIPDKDNGGSLGLVDTVGGSMTTQSITLNQSVDLRLGIYGLTGGTTYDQIVASGTVTLNSPKLLLDVPFSAPAGSEFVLISNTGNLPVTGNFVSESGIALPDGAIISTNFGGSGRTGRISYRGGDGNDVVIVVDGDFTFTSPANGTTDNLRVVSNNGVLQFFVGATLTRTRLQAGLNQIIVQGESGKIDNVQIDYSAGNPSPVGGISLSTGTDTADTLTLLGGQVDAVTQTLASAASSIAVNSGAAVTNISYTKLAKVTDQLASASKSFVSANQANTASLTNSGVNGVTRFAISGLRTFDFVNPTQNLSITTGTFNDTVSVNGLGTGFTAGLNINTASGTDKVTLAPAISALASLNLSAAQIIVNSPALTTTGDQSYTGKVTIGTSAVLAANNFTFSGDVNAVSSGISLTLNTSGNGTTSLLGAVGNTVAFGSLSTNSDGKTIIKGNVSTSTGDLMIADALMLQSAATLKSLASNVVLSGQIDGAFIAMVSAATSVTIGGPTVVLSGLSLTAPSINLNSSSITTTGQQTYTGAVKLGTSAIYTGTQVKFTSTLDGAAPDVGLTVNTTSDGTTSFLGAIGTTQPLKSLTTNSDGKTELKANMFGSGSAYTFNDAVSLLASLSITDVAAGSVTFGSSVNGAFNLQLAVAGSTLFSDAVGAAVALGTSTGPAVTIASPGSTTFAKPLKTTSHMVQSSAAGPVIFQDDVTIVAASVDSSFAGTVVLDGLRFSSNRSVIFGDAETDQVTLSGGPVTMDVATGKASFRSKLTGPQSLVKAGAGILELTNANDYLGSTTLVAGTITRTVANALPATTILNLSMGTNFSLQTFDLTIAGLTGSGNTSLGGRKLTIASTATVDYAGALSGTGGVIKSGGGSQGLSGSNTYTGTTTIQAGLLNVSGKIGTSTVAGNVSVGSGATLNVTGLINANVSGTVGSTINASAGAVLGRDVSVTGFATQGTLNIGQGNVQLLDADTITVGPLTTIAGGTLQVARAFTVGSGKLLSGFGTIDAAQGTLAFVDATASILDDTLTINAGGVSFDSASTLEVNVGRSKLAVNGTVTLSAPTLSSTLINSPDPGFDYVVIDNDGTDPILGKFKDLDQGTQFSYGPERFARSLYYSNVPAVANDFVVRPTKMVATTTATIVSPIDTTDTVRFSSNSSGQAAYLVYSPAAANNNFFRIQLYGPQGTKLKDVSFAPASNLDRFTWGDIAMRENGDFIIAMNGIFESVSGIRLFQFDAAGTLVKTSATIRSQVSYFDSVRLAMNRDGSGVLTWMEPNAASTGYRVDFQQFNSDLSMKTAAPVAVTGFLSSPFDKVAVDLNANGDFVVAWRVFVSSDGQTNYYRTYGRRYTSTGTAMDAAALTVVAKQTDNGRDIGIGLRSDLGMVLTYAKVLYPLTSVYNTVVLRLSPSNTLISERTNEAAGNGSYYGLGLFLSMNDRDEFLVLRSSANLFGDNRDTANFNSYRYVAQKFTANDIPVHAPIDLFTAGTTYNYGDLFRPGVLNHDGSYSLLMQTSNIASGTNSFRTMNIGEPQDAVATSLTVDASNQARFTYDLRSGDAGPLKLKFYKSADPYVDATDQVLASFDLNVSTDLNKGSHTKSFALGSATGQVPIPGFGLPPTDVDYYLLAMLDPDDQMFEIDQETSALDNQARLYFHFNHAPVLAGLPATVNYVENAAAIAISPAGILTDIDSTVTGYTDFNGGSLTISMGITANASDRLGFANQGTGPGQIGKSGTTVSFGGAAIGTFTGGTGATPLTFTFTKAAATPAAVQALLRLLTFETLGDSAATATRTVAISLNDGDGATMSATLSVTVTAVVDNPVIGGLAGPYSYTRNATAGVALAATATITDADTTVFTGGQLRVRISTGADAGNRLYFGTGVTIDASLNVTVGTTVIGTLISDGVGTSDLLVTLNASAASGLVQTLLRNARYKTVAGAAGTRAIQFELTDGTGGISNTGIVIVTTS